MTPSISWFLHTMGEKKDYIIGPYRYAPARILLLRAKELRVKYFRNHFVYYWAKAEAENLEMYAAYREKAWA